MGAGCSSEQGSATSAVSLRSIMLWSRKPTILGTTFALAFASVGQAPVAKAPSVKAQPAAEATSPNPGAPPAAQPSRASVDEFQEEDDTPAKRDPAARMEALHRCFEALDKDKSG